MVNKPVLVNAQVYHERLKPFNHKFFYKIFYLKFSIDQVSQMSNSFFSIDRFNLFSFYSKDYLDGSSRSLREKLSEVLLKENIDLSGEIYLQTIPRVLGYGFNPVSFWYIHNSNKELKAIMAEVNNTFGDRHYYLLEGFDKYQKINAKKVFHVSPFFNIEGEYEFSFHDHSVDINYIDTSNEDLFFKSTLTQLEEVNFSELNLIKLFFKFPLMSFFIMGRIHWQALRLFIKKATFYKRPEPPRNILSSIKSRNYKL